MLALQHWGAKWAELTPKQAHPGVDPVAFARWHIGEIEWHGALRCRAIEITGSSALARALPTWHRPVG